MSACTLQLSFILTYIFCVQVEISPENSLWIEMLTESRKYCYYLQSNAASAFSSFNKTALHNVIPKCFFSSIEFPIGTFKVVLQLFILNLDLAILAVIRKERKVQQESVSTKQ